MEFSCLQENLIKGLSVVSRFVSTKTQLPILLNILLNAQKEGLKLGATNLESGILLKIGAKVEKEGQITIPAKTLTEFIGSLPADKIEFSLEENNLKVTCQKFKAVINGLSATEFPPLSNLNEEENFIFDTGEFSLPIVQTAFAAAQDESRPVLSGIKVFSEEKNLVFVATDGYRLSFKKIPNEKKIASLDIILPARTLTEVVRILTEEKEEKIRLGIVKEGGQVVFSLSNSQVFCRLLEGQFPDFGKIIPTTFSTRAILGREELLSAIKTASIFAREAANVIKFQISSNRFQISANAPQVGENISEVEAKIEGEDGEIAFNSRFLLDFLNIVSQEEVVFEMNGPLSPGVFKVGGDESFLHLIMPVRLQE